MSIQDIGEFAICTDCFMWCHGYSPEENTAERVAEIERGFRLNQVVSTDPYSENGEPHFSWSPCEVCESHLGGDRYDVALFIHESEVTA